MLRVSGLAFRYKSADEAVFEGLDYRFEPGTVTALTGESGRGKSTLLYVLGLMLKPSAGQVVVSGTETSALSDAERSRIRCSMVGFVFQDAALDQTRTILDSVIEPALYAGRRRTDVVGIARDLLNEMRVGTGVTRRPGEISGGQAQRVAVCRALINDPAIILADEPTGNLDRKNAAAVLDLLAGQAAQKSRTVVIATHDPFVLERVDQVLEL